VAYQRGLTTNEVLGACGEDLASRAAERADATSSDADAADDGDGGACRPPPTLPECIQSPPLDATSEESSTDASTEGGDADAEEDEAGPTDAAIVDATTDTGGDQ
jgi:hypothetical protein